MSQVECTCKKCKNAGIIKDVKSQVGIAFCSCQKGVDKEKVFKELMNKKLHS